ncbi:hypothetical protein BIW11_10205 [Tropilaelaps mercedesae]|uniref:Uncharacterized protein n=1 Tax=Tropilaelaps mercedesae TaxID=418985 RepID=A0A1V9XGR3_9ACAR|nr:hypothetical protein BIW11_10205 [Tropilaelaps mercedesae]
MAAGRVPVWWLASPLGSSRKDSSHSRANTDVHFIPGHALITFAIIYLPDPFTYMKITDHWTIVKNNMVLLEIVITINHFLRFLARKFNVFIKS